MLGKRCSLWTGQCKKLSLSCLVFACYGLMISRRPGILVLINDADWGLEGEDSYELKERDNILFVSTLHGG